MNCPPKNNINLDNISEEDLLKVRVCDLPISLEATWVNECINELYKELELKGFSFKPVCYLADEWLTPEGENCIGIPFYLMHSALIRLEKKMMLEAEGDTKAWCMQLLRHETGHVLSHAYKLYKKKKWRKIFGHSSKEYSDTYRFRPYSKSFVRHLEGFYAQYHPDEDFVETFAVWLTPGLDWEKQYAGWKALKKLKYVDSLMREIKSKDALSNSAKKYWQQKNLRITLGNYYKKKKKLRAEDFPDFHDEILLKIFVTKNQKSENVSSAADILRKHRRGIISEVASLSGEKKYVVNDLIKAIYKRCRELKLFLKDSEAVTILRVSSYVAILVMNYSYTGWFRGDKQKRKK